MKTIFYCLFISYISIWASCNKRFDCSQTDYSFEAFYKTYPDRDSLKVGDTIWLELNTPTLIKDLLNNQVIDYSGAENFGTAISYLELVSGANDPPPLPSANYFDNVLKTGILSSTDKPDQIRAYLFKEESGTYLFKLGVVPKKKGLFIIAPGNAANVYRKSDKCSKAGFRLTFKNTNQHLYLYEQNRPGYVLSDYDREHIYAFKVY